jgi:hypothetical protein
VTRPAYGLAFPALGLWLGLLLSLGACSAEGRGAGGDAGLDLTPSDSIPEAFHEIPETPADLPLEEEDPGVADGPLGDSEGGVDLPPPDISEPHPLFPRPEHVRGIYLNAWAAGAPSRRATLLDLAARTEINAFVIDIKDVTGFVSHPTAVPLAREIGATEQLRIRNIGALLDQLKAEGIYPIARIVVTKDPLLTAARPDLAVRDVDDSVWTDKKGAAWLNPFQREVWEYHVALAKEVARLGFPEIQWDYVRFPDAPDSLMARAVFSGDEGRSRSQAIREFLSYAREELSSEPVQMTADVFGVTTTFSRDVGIGQLWEQFIDVVDVALPMVYPSHYWEGSFGFDDPNGHPYEIVRHALSDALSRSEGIEGAGAIRPWLQDFTLGEPFYGAPEVRAQIQAAYDVGIQEWILWNPSSRYTEAALLPQGGLPLWMEPRIRVGGRVVPISERFQVLGIPDKGKADRPVFELPTSDELPGRSMQPALTPDTTLATARRRGGITR